MPKIRTIVAQEKADIVAEMILARIGQSQSFEPTDSHVHWLDGLEDHIRTLPSPPDAVIAVVPAGSLKAEKVATAFPNVLVSQVSIGSDLTRHSIPADGLDDFLAAVYRIVQGSGNGTPPRLDLGQMRSPQDFGGTRLLPEVFDWLDTALELYHEAGATTDQSIPGLAVNPALFSTLLERRRPIHPDDADGGAEARLFEALARSENANDPLVRLVDGLALSSAETKVFLAALACDIDVRYGPLFGILHDDMGRISPSLSLLTAIFGDGIGTRAEIATSGALAGWKLIDGLSSSQGADAALRPDASILNWILGRTGALTDNTTLARIVRRLPWPGEMLLNRDKDIEKASELATMLNARRAQSGWVLLAGPNPDLWRALLERAATQAGLSLLRVTTDTLAELAPPDRSEAILRIARAAMVLDAVVAIEGSDRDSALELAQQLDIGGAKRFPAVFVTAEAEGLAGALNGPLLRVSQTDAGPKTMAHALQEAVQGTGGHMASETARRLASTFSLDLGSIEDAVAIATLEDTESFEGFSSAIRRVLMPKLPRFATRVSPTFQIDDIVVDDTTKAQLLEIPTHIRQATTVLGDWGFGAQLPYGRGVVAMFCGPSGTGKTMAAQAIAHELETELFQVDLSRIVSKFVGETEKNLDAVFRDAERAGALLCFEEGDATFGRRSETKDAHDRYANIEVSYLLQRIEAYSGLVVLTTNFRQNIDPAFTRRLRFIVEFARPDSAARAAIWRYCLPQSAPLSNDVDLSALSHQIDLTGGEIRQASLRAAFAAAHDGEPIAMRHLIRAVRAELQKTGRNTSIRDLDAYEARRLAAA